MSDNRPAAAVPQAPPPRESRFGLALVAVATLALVVRAGFVQSLHVSQRNMAPTLDRDDRVLVTAYGREPGPGDVVAYRSPLAFGDPFGRLEVGRIVAAGGSRVELDPAGLRIDDVGVTVATGDCASGGGAAHGPAATGGGDARQRDGDSVAELVAAEEIGGHCYFTRKAGVLAGLMFPAKTVPPGHVFILNDNRVDERDSRIYGAIPVSAVVGVASFVYYASDQTGIRWDRMNRRVS